MKILFFDMEFANGNIPGSVYSLGYVQTNERFVLTEPQTDLLINPDCEWHWYVKKNILSYPVKTVEAASLFPAYYRRIRRLLCKADLVVGFAVQNDTMALKKACERYGLKPFHFQCLDMEKMCKRLKDHPEAHGLSGLVRAYCGIQPENQHRSDGDAYATMMLLQKICEIHHLAPQKITQEFENCMIPSLSSEEPKKKKKAGKAGQTHKIAKKENSPENETTVASAKSPKGWWAGRRKRFPGKRADQIAGIPEITDDKTITDSHRI